MGRKGRSEPQRHKGHEEEMDDEEGAWITASYPLSLGLTYPSPAHLVLYLCALYVFAVQIVSQITPASRNAARRAGAGPGQVTPPGVALSLGTTAGKRISRSSSALSATVCVSNISRAAKWGSATM